MYCECSSCACTLSTGTIAAALSPPIDELSSGDCRSITDGRFPALDDPDPEPEPEPEPEPPDEYDPESETIDAFSSRSESRRASASTCATSCWRDVTDGEGDTPPLTLPSTDVRSVVDGDGASESPGASAGGGLSRSPPGLGPSDGGSWSLDAKRVLWPSGEGAESCTPGIGANGANGGESHAETGGESTRSKKAPKYPGSMDVGVGLMKRFDQTSWKSVSSSSCSCSSCEVSGMCGKERRWPCPVVEIPREWARRGSVYHRGRIGNIASVRVHEMQL